MDEYNNIFLEYVLNSDGLPSDETIETFKNWDLELGRWAETIKKNPIAKDLDDFLKKEIHSTEISDEERDKLYLRYLEMRLALLDRSIELAKTFARPNYPAKPA